MKTYLPQSLRNYKEEAKIKPSEKALAMSGQKISYRHCVSQTVFVARLSKSLATLTLGSSKINQHCWRFHGSGVIAAPQIIGLIHFVLVCTMSIFFRSSMCFRVPHLCPKIPKINNWLENSPQSFGVYTVSQSRSVVNVRGESGPI